MLNESKYCKLLRREVTKKYTWANSKLLFVKLFSFSPKRNVFLTLKIIEIYGWEGVIIKKRFCQIKLLAARKPLLSDSILWMGINRTLNRKIIQGFKRSNFDTWRNMCQPSTRSSCFIFKLNTEPTFCPLKELIGTLKSTLNLLLLSDVPWKFQRCSKKLDLRCHALFH
jgi:hypothetical protein